MKLKKSKWNKLPKRVLLIGIMVMTLIGVAALCTNPVAAGGRNMVTIGMWSSPGNSLIPMFYHLGYARAVYRLLFSPLLEWNDNLDIVPKMAESYTVSPDGLTYTFKIRENAFWQDGEPVTSRDVEFSINCLSDPGYSFMDFNLISGIAGAKDRKEGKNPNLSGFKIIDDKTFEVKTEKVFAPLLDGLTELYILPYHILKGIPVADIIKNPFASNPTVGCGPYRFVKHATDQYIEMVRNDAYFLGTPKIEKVFLQIMSPDSAIAQLERGELDVVLGEGLGDIPNIEIARIKKIPHLELQRAYSPGCQGLNLMTTHEKFKDLRVRRALAHALNTKGIIQKILLDGGSPIPTGRAVGFPFFNKTLSPYAYNPEKARALLKEAGWDPNTPLRLVAPTGNKERLQWATVAQQNFKDVGIKAELQQFDIATMIKMIRTTPEELDGYFVGLQNYMDPHLYFHRRFHSESIPGGNLMYYSNPEVDSLIEQGAATLDKSKRTVIYDKIQAILHNELPLVPIVSPTSTIAVNKHLKGVRHSILSLTRNIHEWEIQ